MLRAKRCCQSPSSAPAAARQRAATTRSFSRSATWAARSPTFSRTRTATFSPPACATTAWSSSVSIPRGTPLWANAFRLGTNTLLIRDLMVDASGDLIGVAYYETGFAADAKSTVFRYHIATNSFVWVQHISDVLFTNIHDFDANNCLLTGTGNGGYTQLAHIDKSTGAVSTYALQGEGGEYFSVLQNGHLYGACRRYYNSFGDFRASVFSHDAATGAFEWQNSLISEGNESGPNQTRMYPEKPALDNDSLVVIASGDLVGFDLYLDGPTELVVAKTDLLGNLGWTKQYLVSGYNRPVAARIANTADGYYIVANMYLSSLSNFGFGVLIKTDKQGNVQWAKRLGISGKNIVKNIMERNGFLHLVLASDSYAPNELLLLKLDLQGNSNAACDFIQPITVTVNHLPAVQNARPYTVSNRVNTLTPVVETPNSTPFSNVSRCSTSCSNSLAIHVTLPNAGNISGPNFICVNDSYLLTTDGTPGGEWSSDDPSVAQVNMNSGFVYAQNPGTCTISYTLTENGCTNTSYFFLEVRPTLFVIAISNSPVCAGDDVILDEIGGEAVNWDWFGPNGFYVSGIKNLIIPNATPDMSGIYTVVGLGANGCQVYSDVQVEVGALPDVNNNCSISLCENPPGSGQATFDLTDSESCSTMGMGGLSVRYFTEAGLINEITPPDAFLSGTTTVYTLITHNSTGCTSSGSLSLVVTPGPTMDTPASLEICAEEFITSIQFSSNQPDVAFQWTNDNPAIGLPAAGSGDIPDFVTQNNTGAPITATITVTPKLGGDTHAPTLICNNGLNIDIVPPMGTLSYSDVLYFANDDCTPVNELEFSIIKSSQSTGMFPTDGQGDPFGSITFSCFDLGYQILEMWVRDLEGNVDYCNAYVIVTDNTGYCGMSPKPAGAAPDVPALKPVPEVLNSARSANHSACTTCFGTPVSFTITVYPDPTVDNLSDVVVCNGVSVSPTIFAGSVPGTVFNWSNNNPGIGLPANGTGDLPAFAAVNTGSTPIWAMITVVPTMTFGGITCTGYADSFQIFIYPQPDATITTSATAQVCPGTTGLTASVPDAGPGATYTWTILNGTITDGQGTNSITYTADAPGQTVLTVTVVGPGGCSAAGCNNTFIQSLGNMGGSQPNIFPHPNGDFFATGLRNDSMVIIRFDPSGTPLWANAFRLGTNTLLIRDLMVDASGDLIGVAYYETGAAADAKSTVFRYHIATNSFVWVQHISEVLFTNIHDFDANNCVLTGTGNGGFTQLAHIDKSTGAVSTYALQGEGGDYYSVLQNGHLCGACRQCYNAGGRFPEQAFFARCGHGRVRVAKQPDLGRQRVRPQPDPHVPRKTGS
ncbi:MAG: hypothetical protein IPM98_03920 [Lewinellaceae bacterium]|nr:hypothetical protein [Lewinellaceae bacterium]